MQKDLVNSKVCKSRIIHHCRFKAPLLFELPQNDYSAEMARIRNKSLYLKVAILKKKSQQIKEEIQTLTKRHRKHVENIRRLIAKSREVTNLFRTKRGY